MAWLAVDSPDTAAVVRAVGLRDSGEATWAEGWRRRTAGRCTSPHRRPSGRWRWYPLFRPPDALAATVKPLVRSLSRQFGDAHYYCSHRDIGLYAWARASGGKLVRGYGGSARKARRCGMRGNRPRTNTPSASGARTGAHGGPG